MFENNNFARDTNEQHNQRVLLCAPASATYKVELGLRDSWVADIAAHAISFTALLDKWNIEDAEYHGSTADLKAKRETLYAQNTDARWMIKTIIDDPAVDPGTKRMIDDAFDIDADLTKGVDTLATATKAIFVGQAKLIEIGAAWGLPAAVVTNLHNALTAMETAFAVSKKEHGEKLQAMEDIYQARLHGENLLRNIYRWCVAVWGDDEERLLEFGFVPKSQIFTPGDGLPVPQFLMYDQFRNQFSWETVPGAEKYELIVKNTATQVETTYATAQTVQKLELAKGEYSAKVRAIRDANPIEYSDWSVEIPVSIKIGAPGNLNYNPASHKFSWGAIAEATIYQLVQADAADDIYLGGDTGFTYTVVGTAKFRVRAANDTTSQWGEWSAWITVSA